MYPLAIHYYLDYSNNVYMSLIKNKKSTEWLEPLRLNEDDAKAFHVAVSTKPSKEVLEKQVKLFEVAQKLK